VDGEEKGGTNEGVSSAAAGTPGCREASFPAKQEDDETGLIFDG